jgi:hypothetical protein
MPASSCLPAELGDFESAGKYYDLCIAAIRNEGQQPTNSGGSGEGLLSGTWDA